MINSKRINRYLYVDERFFEFLTSYNNRVCIFLLNFDTTDNINYISPSDTNDMISFLPKSKYKNLEGSVDPYGDDIGRSVMKVGRILSNLYTTDEINGFSISKSDIEEFVNLYKSHFDESNREFEIFKGEELKKYYLDYNYMCPGGNGFGSLWRSCMRYPDRQDFLSLYTKNPNVFSLLVLFSKNEYGERKVRARALLCDAVSYGDYFTFKKGDPVKVMDRIYSIYDSDVNIFKKWAKENGYIFRFEQNMKTKDLFSSGNDNFFIGLRLELDEHKIEYYPYLDTFTYYDPRKGFLYNFPHENYIYELRQTNGMLEREEEPEPFYDTGIELSINGEW